MVDEKPEETFDFKILKKGVDFLELKLGFMSTKEMHLWFGYTEKSHALSTAKGKERLQELDDYCKWKKVRGGFEIIEIYDDKDIVYVKGGSQSKRILRKAFDNDEWGFEEGSNEDTHINFAVRMVNAHSEITVQKETAAHYAGEIRKEYYGKPNDLKHGSRGYCTSRLMKKYGENGSAHFKPFTKEDEEIVYQTFEEFFGETMKTPELLQAIDNYLNNVNGAGDELASALIAAKKINQSRWFCYFQTLSARLGCTYITKVIAIHKNNNNNK